jgi:hypothetical protein
MPRLDFFFANITLFIYNSAIVEWQIREVSIDNGRNTSIIFNLLYEVFFLKIKDYRCSMRI